MARLVALLVLASALAVSPVLALGERADAFTTLDVGAVEDDGGLPVEFVLVGQNAVTPYYNPQGVTISGHAEATYACTTPGGYVLRTEAVRDVFVQADYYFPVSPEGVSAGELELYPPPSWLDCHGNVGPVLKRIKYFAVSAGYGLARVGLAPIPGTFERVF